MKLNKYGYDALDKIKAVGDDRMNGGTDRDLVFDVAKLGNATARTMDSTLRVEKHNLHLRLSQT